MPDDVAAVASRVDHPIVKMLARYLFLFLNVKLPGLALTGSVLQRVRASYRPFVDRRLSLIGHIVETFFIVVILAVVVIVVEGALLIRRLLFVLTDLTL